MDTITQKNTMLPVAGVASGVIGLLLGVTALVQLSTVRQSVADHELKIAQIGTVKATADGAAATADKTKSDLVALSRATQEFFNQVEATQQSLRSDVSKVQESLQARSHVAGKDSGLVAAGPNEYVVKPGDSFAKIARTSGCPLVDIQAVNPNVDSAHLKVGQKIKLPSRK